MAALEGNHGDVDGCSVQEPVAIGPGPEDCAGLLDSLEHVAIGAAADALRGEQTDAGDGFNFELGAGFLEPVDDEVGFGFDAAFL